LFRLIVNNIFKDSKKLEFDISNPYRLFSDFYFARYLVQLFFLEENELKNRDDFNKLRATKISLMPKKTC